MNVRPLDSPVLMPGNLCSVFESAVALLFFQRGTLISSKCVSVAGNCLMTPFKIPLYPVLQVHLLLLDKRLVLLRMHLRPGNIYLERAKL